MTGTFRSTAALLTFFALMALGALTPVAAFAQSSDDLHSTIRAQLLSDPRAAALSQAQLDAMVDILAGEAAKQGLSARDIEWRPETLSGAPQGYITAGESCAGSFTCTLAEAWGFVGPDVSIPFLLGMASMGLLWILAEMMYRRKYAIAPASPSTTPS